jgi:hypothetical protein
MAAPAAVSVVSIWSAVELVSRAISTAAVSADTATAAELVSATTAVETVSRGCAASAVSTDVVSAVLSEVSLVSSVTRAESESGTSAVSRSIAR